MLINKNNKQHIFVESNVIRLSRFMCFGTPGIITNYHNNGIKMLFFDHLCQCSFEQIYKYHPGFKLRP